MKMIGKYALQGKNKDLRFQVLVDPAIQEPDVYTIKFADFEPVQVHRLPAEQTLDFFARVVKRLAELREELETDNCPNLVGSYVHRKQRERRWKYQFDWAQIYGASHADCEDEIMKETVVSTLRQIAGCEYADAESRLKAIDLLIKIFGIGLNTNEDELTK